ncbi:hypothetical protein [Marinicella rhabdoformis]|uniref:hypothetical protein n=1 Tax=Marinicella rhabdoformis TaxID=2580566 RepID=UPI0012AEB7DE|nr:hypothetical protein [Marinicella rhabdoformis]
MHLFHIKNQESFLQLIESQTQQLKELKKTEQQLTQALASKQQHLFHGYSWPIQRESQFLLDQKYAHSGEINFRERLVCQSTQFNNRVRGAIQVFETTIKPKPCDTIYISEQHTLLYKWLKNKYTNTVGSEYMTESSFLNKLRFQLKLLPDKLNHQDLTQLSFNDNHFKYV